MNRKLLILDLVLAALAIYAGFQFHSRRLASKAHEAAVLNRKPAPLPAPQFTPLATAPAVLSAGYAEIAQKLLFDRSRNSTVVVEVTPPPPPKPMPPLPVYHGMMNIGDGPAAILSVNATAPQMEIHPGETIGPFKLVDVTSQEIALEWDGKIIRKTKYSTARRGRWLRTGARRPADLPRQCFRSSRHRSARVMMPARAIRFVNRTTARPTAA